MPYIIIGALIGAGVGLGIGFVAKECYLVFALLCAVLCAAIGLAIAFTPSYEIVKTDVSYHELTPVNGCYVSDEGKFVTVDELRGSLYGVGHIDVKSFEKAPFIEKKIFYYKQNSWKLYKNSPDTVYDFTTEKKQ